MLLRRVTQHFVEQNWFAVFLDFLIVVFGVFIGIQVANWNESRIEREREKTLMLTLREDILDHIDEMVVSESTFNDIKSFGNTAAAVLSDDSTCTTQCWQKLVALFQASQWVDVRYNRETYDEILRSGFPQNGAVKEQLSTYHTMNEQASIILAHLPVYRERVRSIIPVAVQDHMWENCWAIVGRQQTLKADCTSNISNDQAASILELIKRESDVLGYLNFWLSTVSVVKRTIPDQVLEARTTLSVIDSYLANHH